MNEQPNNPHDPFGDLIAHIREQTIEGLRIGHFSFTVDIKRHAHDRVRAVVTAGPSRKFDIREDEIPG